MKRIILTGVTILTLLAVPDGARAESYRHMTVRDFMIDAEILTRQRAHIEVSGAYMLAGSLDELYANGVDVANVRQGYTTPPFIPLMTEHASRTFRAALFDCRSSGAYYCMITVRGTVTRCAVSNIVGTQEATCISVEDGGIYEPPRPTAEQVAEQQAAVAAAEQQRIAEASRQVDKWERRVANCLVNSPLAQASPGPNPVAPQVAIGRAIGRFINPARTKTMAADNKAMTAYRLYAVCANQPWPVGAAVPDRLPDTIQNVIDQCTATRDWQFCTGNNPPRP